MPVTRSSSRLAARSASGNAQEPPVEPPAPSKTVSKRKGSASEPKATKKKTRKDEIPATSVPAPVNASGREDSPVSVPAVLSFSFEDGKNHLISVDRRFEDLFSKMKCRPFEQLERLHPFRALATSILGQQISWLAARSITHKFIRLYDPSLPEKVTDYAAQKSPSTFFPTPRQVATTDLATLRTAGLSGRKAEYIQDLATRFADGRLSTEKLIEADDEEMARMLIEVKGIGRWTVDMFAIFSLRRPDILPVGDLGVQRGMLRWFLALHSPLHRFSLSPEKVVADATKKKNAKSKDDDTLPVFDETAEDDEVTDVAAPVLDASSTPSVPASPPIEEAGLMPMPFTPSIEKTLNTWNASTKPPRLPEGLTVAVLKSRLDGKKKIKGAFLTPKEMEELTESWKPYRSLGVYYMWSLMPEVKST